MLCNDASQCLGCDSGDSGWRCVDMAQYQAGKMGLDKVEKKAAWLVETLGAVDETEVDEMAKEQSIRLGWWLASAKRRYCRTERLCWWRNEE